MEKKLIKRRITILNLELATVVQEMAREGKNESLILRTREIRTELERLERELRDLE